ncbi:hypothetical protein ENUP19_0020G0026 [Entamoeba nuttalli]|uniref:Protein with RhoGEF and ArfGAP domains, putative n=2 Tax=Entamoeba nuttalli TaxID=412467 RepID=K2G5U0_ENTNP|nr:protein with RhoGEF and ArfGAP domains, putative [Entamoeba nuttalli P19]EKE37716.1 protein with RhoGEF and ArfGAP domains, putative [Entamoeba nuttalli P19]|eukprot:XP_008859949.1 protein with RhoGEF and ArfGAP domains, putative [Entamoeba nuttalli P19]
MEDHTQLYIDWVNEQLAESKGVLIINSLDDLTDGVILLRLVEKLTHLHSRNIEPHPITKEQKLININAALRLAERKFGTLHGVEVSNIADGDEKVTLGFIEVLKTSSEADRKRSQTITRQTFVKKELIRSQNVKMNHNVNFTIKNIETSRDVTNGVRISVAKRPQMTTSTGNITSTQSNNSTPIHERRNFLQHNTKITSFHDLSTNALPPVPLKSYRRRKEEIRKIREARKFTSTDIEEVEIDGKPGTNVGITKGDVKRINEKVFEVKGKYFIVTGVKDDENVMEELKLTPKGLKEFVTTCARQILTEQKYLDDIEKEDKKFEHLEQLQDNIFAEKLVIKLQCLIRGHFVRRTQEVQGMKTRKYTINEITTSEETYVNNLIILKDFYLQKLLDFNKDELLKNTIKDLEMIIKYNQTLLNSLLQFRKDKNIYGDGFAKQFLQFTMFLKSYTTYVNHQSQISDDIYQKSIKNKNYGNKLKELSLQPEVKNQTIASYLILPVQRIPRYELFIKQLIKNMPNHHKERQELTRALKVVSDINKHLNETRRNNENIQRVQFLASKITLKKIDLAGDKYRRFIMGGFVRLQGHPTKFNLQDLFPEKQHLMLLFSDIVLFIPATKPSKIIEDNPVDTLLNSGKFKCRDVLELFSTSLIDFNTNRFFLITKELTYLIACESMEDKSKYMNAINDCLVLKYSPLVARSAELIKQNGISSNTLNLQEVIEKNKQLLAKPDFEGEATYRDLQTGIWEPCYLMLIGSILYIYKNTVDIFNGITPIKMIDVSNFIIKSPIVSARPSSFEISFRYEVNTFSVKDDESKSLWLIALRNAFAKFNIATAVSKEQALPIMPLKEPLPFIPDDIKMTEGFNFVLNLLIIPGNRICADCLFREVSYVDLDYGVFVCGPCSRSHMKLSHKQLKKGGVPLLTFKQVYEYPINDLLKLQALGNLRANSFYTKTFSLNQIPSKEQLQSASASFMAQWIVKKYPSIPEINDIIN